MTEAKVNEICDLYEDAKDLIHNQVGFNTSKEAGLLLEKLSALRDEAVTAHKAEREESCGSCTEVEGDMCPNCYDKTRAGVDAGLNSLAESGLILLKMAGFDKKEIEHSVNMEDGDGNRYKIEINYTYLGNEK